MTYGKPAVLHSALPAQVVPISPSNSLISGGNLMTVTLTEKAEFRLRAFLQGSADASSEKGIRVGVSDGGCNGYEYTIDIANAPRPDDLIEMQGRVRLYIDPKSAPLLQGVVIDFLEGLMESGFKFSNPNATDTCGCGKSFQAGDCTPAAVPCS
jgi:iron-sulfur cluster assembly protein